MLAYLSRYTHRVAIANSRLIRFDDHGVTFTWKDYRAKGRDRYKVMTLATPEFIRRFLLHVLPHGFHRIRHYGLFANGARVETHQDQPDPSADDHDQEQTLTQPCSSCGGRMIIIETFEPSHAWRDHAPRAPPSRGQRT